MIETFKNLDFSAGGEYEPTKENFPWAKIFFTGAGVDLTGLTITEALSGAKYVITNPAVERFSTEVDAQPIAGSGSIAQTVTGTPSCMAVMATTPLRVNKFKVGSGDGMSLDAPASGASPILTCTGNTGGASSSVAATAYSITSVLSASNFYGLFSAAAAINGFEGGEANSYNALATVFALHSIQNIDDAITLNEVENFKGFLIYAIDSYKADYVDGLHWMQYQWSVGNYYLYPPWKGLSS